ncbi:unnamed protein product, partial [Timema podura]|nr:unnamed protein product [Timema podura]
CIYDRYRVAAVDHGLFSFIDVHHRDWPVILITNPKHTLYKMPTREPLDRMRKSTHIRMLIFSLSHIVDVKVKVDEEGWRPCTEVKGPLYVAMWEPNKYSQGLHYIHVLIISVKSDSCSSHDLMYEYVKVDPVTVRKGSFY